MRNFGLVEVLLFQWAREKFIFYNIFGYVLSFLIVRGSDLY